MHTQKSYTETETETENHTTTSHLPDAPQPLLIRQLPPIKRLRCVEREKCLLPLPRLRIREDKAAFTAEHCQEPDPHPR
jgi:hypothetical protein